jgi:hypothetical protein
MYLAFQNETRNITSYLLLISFLLQQKIAICAGQLRTQILITKRRISFYTLYKVVFYIVTQSTNGGTYRCKYLSAPSPNLRF